MSNLRQGTGPVLSGTGIQLVAWGLGQTLLSDSDRDKLKGNKSRDWFFASLTDRLSSRKSDDLFAETP